MSSHFDVISVGSPNHLEKKYEDVDATFAPLGYEATSKYLDFLPNLKCLISNTTGIAHIDVDYCKRRGIFVSALHDQQEFLETITPTAEHTIGLMLAAHRKLLKVNASVVVGQTWNRRSHGAPFMLSRATIGIIGLGRVGRRVAIIAQSMGMKVKHYDPYVTGGVPELSDLFLSCDVIAICAIANDETRGLVSRELLSMLRPTSIVVNTARGEIIDLDSLLEFLSTGKIYAAALDTIDGEYEENFEKSRTFQKVVEYSKYNDNLILTPHIAGSTLDAWRETEGFVIKRAVEYLTKP